MHWNFTHFLKLFSDSKTINLLKSSGHAFEREALRVNSNGELSTKNHPARLGSSLTHRSITTDYSEAQIELITRPHRSEAALLTSLSTLFKFVQTNIGSELLWPSSMPCRLPDSVDIPLADYGHSNIGRFKKLYRYSLGLRYNRKMQTICGIHYNFSFSKQLFKLLQNQFAPQKDLQEFINDSYLHLTRNFFRHQWLLIYLFGASPAIDQSFLQDSPEPLQKLYNNTYIGPYATSLRLSNFGYTSEVQKRIKISYNQFADYLHGLEAALRTPAPEYQKIGLQNDSQHIQINANILQIEAEMYAPVRLKHPPHGTERLLNTLKKRGVQYLEVRIIDNNPFHPLGIDLNTLRFLHLMMIYCLGYESPSLSENELNNLRENNNRIALFGRDPKIKINHQSHIFTDLEKIAILLDQSLNHNSYQQTLQTQIAKIKNPHLTPSAILLNELQQSKLSFVDFNLKIARAHRKFFLKNSLSPKSTCHFQHLAKESLRHQRHLEETDKISFQKFLKHFRKKIPSSIL